jgi:hypothetical protein
MRWLPRAPGERETGGRTRKGSRSGSAPRPAEITSREEALQVLGLEPGASREEIVTAHRNLIRKVHPDSPGGSTYLASKLNQAKDILVQ